VETSEIKSVIETGMARIEAKYGNELEKLGLKVRELQMKSGGAGLSLAGLGGGGLLAKLSADPQLKAMTDREAKSAIIKLDASIGQLLTKSTVVGDGGSSTSATPEPLRGQLFGEDPRRRLSVLDMLPRLPVSAASFQFEQLDNYAAAANYQAAEGEPKPQTNVPMALQTVPIPTIAHFINASEQVLSDVPYLQRLLDGLLRYGVLRRLENEIIAGNTVGKIAGLQSQADTFTPSSSSGPLVDQIGEALTELDIRGWNPGAVLLHPSDWQAIRSERDQENAYVSSGWQMPAGPTIWGVPAATSPAVTVGRPLVLDPAQVVVLDRQQATVEVGRTGDGFIENVLTLRGELRAGLAVFSPSAVLRLV
jgi:HK97 family phage major capsid protein